MGEQDSSWAKTFFNDIINHPVPLDMNILKALKKFPAGPRFLHVGWSTAPFTFERAPLPLSWPHALPAV